MTDDDKSKINLMPIGRFSNACRLSIKALRYYDERGVLKPAFVDSETGYRYYRSDQSRDAVIIALLRSMDVSLESIKNVLYAEGDELREFLDIERARIERELSRKSIALRSIERISQRGDLIPYSVAIRDAPDYRLASIHCTTTAERMVQESGELMYTLFDLLGRTEIAMRDPYMCINEAPNKKGEVIVHACVGVADNVNVNEPVTLIDISGGPEAWLTHIGAYEELGLAYHTLSAWVQARGHQQRAALREIYLNDPAETDTDELITEVIVPIEG